MRGLTRLSICPLAHTPRLVRERGGRSALESGNFVRCQRTSVRRMPLGMSECMSTNRFLALMGCEEGLLCHTNNVNQLDTEPRRCVNACHNIMVVIAFTISYTVTGRTTAAYLHRRFQICAHCYNPRGSPNLASHSLSDGIVTKFTMPLKEWP